jgi:uncharacterized repeat protein (TIGR01451 family)
MTIDRPAAALPAGAARTVFGVAAAAVLWTGTAGWGHDPPAAASAGRPQPARAAAPAPRLRIAIDDGRTATRSGQTLTYTVTVTNLGLSEVGGLQLTQSVPSEAKLVSAAGASAAKGGRITWRLDLKASGVATFHATMTVTRTPPQLLRLATVACAGTSASAPPIVCAADSDQLPAGAPAPAAAAATHRGGWWYIAVAAGLVAVGLAAVASKIRSG